MSTRALVETFNNWSAESEALVLVTVVETQGSTYSKPGRQLIMQPDGRHAGLVSGGCLEGDLAEHARRVFETGEPALVTYDMRDDADDLWGIGLGCNGLMQLLLQRISAAENWAPFAAAAKALADSQAHTLRLVTASNAASHPVGTLNADPATELPQGVTALSWQSRPWVRLLVLGAAPDAVPVSELARKLGWAVTIADHRPNYLDSNDFSLADRTLLVDPADLAANVDVNAFTAIVVMSHHLETDYKYLQQLGNVQTPYIGLLGPAARKQKLLDRLGADAGELATKLHGPVGLDIGSDSPETIALALLGEIQASLAHQYD